MITNSNDKFEIDGRQYLLDKNDLDCTHASATHTNSLPHACNLDQENLKQLQQHEYITKLNAKYKSAKNNETPYYLDEHGITYRKIRDRPNIFHAIMVPIALQPYILYECHNALGHNGSTRMYHFIRRYYYWKK